MANWCSTTIQFYSTNQNRLAEFINSIKECATKSFCKDDEDWKGCFGNLAYKFFPDEPDKHIVRGFFSTDETDFIAPTEKDEFGYYSWRLFCDTAWSSKIGIWYDILQFFPEVELSYIAEEGGCGYYVKNDVVGYFPDNFILDFEIDEDNNEYAKINEISSFHIYFSNREELFEFLEDAFKNNDDLQKIISQYKKCSDFDISSFENDMQKILNNIDEDSYFTCQKFEIENY